MTIRAVLFDCDGVLVDSEPLTDAVIARSLARHGLALGQHEISGMFRGGTLAGVAETAREMGADLPEDWLARTYDDIHAKLAEGTPLVPGIEGVLDRLDAAGIAYAVGSNGSHRKMEVTLGQHPDLRRRFGDRVFSREDVARPKPAPDLYLHAAHALGVAPAQAAVIEDSPTGARAARAAGIRCFGYAAAEKADGLLAEGATVFRDMADLPGLLGL